MRESTIESHLVKRVKALGGEVRKVQWVGRRGAPDRLVMVPAVPYSRMTVDQLADYDEYSRARTIWVELKAPGVEPEPHQVREHVRLRAMGQRVEVIDSIEGVERLLA